MVNEIKDFDFQDDCVDFLIEKTVASDSKQVITVKAPTGAGKTVILIKYIDDCCCINQNMFDNCSKMHRCYFFVVLKLL